MSTQCRAYFSMSRDNFYFGMVAIKLITLVTSFTVHLCAVKLMSKRLTKSEDFLKTLSDSHESVKTRLLKIGNIKKFNTILLVLQSLAPGIQELGNISVATYITCASCDFHFLAWLEPIFFALQNLCFMIKISFSIIFVFIHFKFMKGYSQFMSKCSCANIPE